MTLGAVRERPLHPDRGRGCEVRAFAGTTYVPLRPVCAPLSRTLDSSLRWNDGDRGQGCEVPVCTGTTGSHSGVRRSGKTFNFRPFPLISDLRLRFVPSRERRMCPSAPCALRCLARWIPAFAGMTGTGDRDARFPSARERRGATQECVGVAKLLISAHFRSFPIIPLVDAGGGLHPHQGLDSSHRWNGGDRGDARFPPAQGSDGGRVDSWTHLALVGLVYSYG